MKKLAIVVLLVVSACGRQAVVTSTPTQPSSPANAAAGTPGATTPREAVNRFMAAAKAQDLQAMSIIWGDSRGPARNTMDRETLEMREIFIMKCLRHDSFDVPSDTPLAGGGRVFAVDLRFRTLTARSNFETTAGPEGRFYVTKVDLDNQGIKSICSAR